MLIRRVVRHKVDDDPDSPLLGGMREFDEITKRSVARIDLVVVRNIVAVVTTGRGLEGHQPYGCDGEPAKIVEPTHEPGEISHSIPVGIHVSGHGEAIDDRILVPEIVDHEDGRSLPAVSATIKPSFARKPKLVVDTSSCRSR